MEFSETFELNDLIKFSPGTKSKRQGLASSKNTLLETMMNFGLELEEKLANSPRDYLPKEFNTHTELQTEPIEPVILEEKRQDPVQVVLQVQRDDSYKETYIQSLGKVSTLTQSLKNDLGVKRFQGIPITVYLFSTHDTLKINIPKKATIEQVIPRVISAYIHDEKFKEKPLPHGPVAEAYEIRMLDEVTFLPEKDFDIEKSLRIKDLSVEALGFCVKPGFKDLPETAITLPTQHPEQGRVIKVYYGKSYNLFQISDHDTLGQLLEKMSAHYGYLSPNEFEFKVGVLIEELNEQECDISMDLKISSLTTDEIKLYKKVYVDTPSFSKINKESPPIKEENHESRYDKSRIYMSRAQACTYKEYEVIKTNSKGKRQKRILGINQHRLHNMTVAQAKELLKEKATGKSEKNVFKKKFQSIFKSVTHHPEIPISSISCIEQDTKNFNCFYIDYVESGKKKKKLYETEKSSIAVEIISKISMLILLVRFI
jgi:hypothetical protein